MQYRRDSWRTIACSRVAVVRSLTLEIRLPQPADAGRSVVDVAWPNVVTVRKRNPEERNSIHVRCNRDSLVAEHPVCLVLRVRTESRIVRAKK